MKILIVGDDFNSNLLAEYIKLQNSDVDIFITRDEDKTKEYTSLNISPYNTEELKDFAKYNDIDFTICLSGESAMNGIADEFEREGLKIFAPQKQPAGVMYFNSIEKKLMYKLKIPVSKFGIFDRENIAGDYLRNSKFPVVVKNDFTLFENIEKKCSNYVSAKAEIAEIFEKYDKKAVVENYVSQDPVYLYFITDGYNALPIADIKKHKYEEYEYALSPSGKISHELIMKILNGCVYPLLDDISKFAGVYKGIFRLKLYVKNDGYIVGGISNGFDGCDFQVFLANLGENVLDLFSDAANGELCKYRDRVELKDLCSCSVSFKETENNKFIQEECDLFSYKYGDEVIITAEGLNVKSAVQKLREETINFMPKDLHKEIFEVREKERLKI